MEKPRRKVRRRHPVGMVVSAVVLLIAGYAVFNSQLLLEGVRAQTPWQGAKLMTRYFSNPEMASWTVVAGEESQPTKAVSDTTEAGSDGDPEGAGEKVSDATGSSGASNEANQAALPEGSAKRPLVFAAEGMVFQVEDQKLTAFSSQGIRLWEKAFYGGTPYVSAFAGKLLVADFDVGDVYLLHTADGKIAAKRQGIGTIQALHSDGGYLGCLITDDSSIHLLDKNLKDVGSCPVTIADLTVWGIAGDEKQLLLATPEIFENGVSTHMGFYDFSGKLLQAINLPGEVLYDIRASKDGFLALSDVAISRYRFLGGARQWQQFFFRPLANYTGSDQRWLVNTSGEEPAVTGSSDAKTGYSNALTGYDFSGQAVFRVENLDLLAEHMVDTGEFVLVVGQQKLYVYNNKGKNTSLQMLAKPLIALEAVDSRTILLVYQEGFEIATIVGR